MEPSVRRMWWIGGPILTFFLVGGLVFWKTMPQVGIGQIWVAVSLFLLVLYSAITVVIGRGARERSRLLRDGLRGTAQVLAADHTGVVVNRRPRMKLHLQVQLPGRAPYEVTHVETLPWVTRGSLDRGELAVAVDRNDPQRLAIDWAQAPTTANAPRGIGVRTASAATEPSAGTVSRRLAQLDEAHRRQLINDAEFAEQRRRLLGEF